MKRFRARGTRHAARDPKYWTRRRTIRGASTISLFMLSGFLLAAFSYGSCRETPIGNFDCFEVRLGVLADPYVAGSAGAALGLLVWLAAEAVAARRGGSGVGARGRSAAK